MSDDTSRGFPAFAQTDTIMGNDRYTLAHPNSALGDPNEADRRGYELVAIHEGKFIYRKKAGDFQEYWIGGLTNIILAVFVFILVLFPPESLNTRIIGIFLSLFWLLNLADLAIRLGRNQFWR